MFTISLVLIAVFGGLCGWTIHAAREIEKLRDHSERERHIDQLLTDLERTYWNRRYPENHWP